MKAGKAILEKNMKKIKATGIMRKCPVGQHSSILSESSIPKYAIFIST